MFNEDVHGMTIASIVSYVLRDADDGRIVVGPVVWYPSDGTKSKIWAFVIATSQKGRGFRCDQIVGGDVERLEVIAALLARPLVVHVMQDEVDMARLCEQLWPGERISKLRAAVEAESPIAASRQ